MWTEQVKAGVHGKFTDDLYYRADDDHVSGGDTFNNYCEYCGVYLGRDQWKKVDVHCSVCGYEIQIRVMACGNTTCLYGAARKDSTYGSSCTRNVTCSTCDGLGKTDGTCSNCGGDGKVTKYHYCTHGYGRTHYHCQHGNNMGSSRHD